MLPLLLSQLTGVRGAVVLDNNSQFSRFGDCLKRLFGSPVHHFDITRAFETATSECVFKAFIRLPQPQNEECVSPDAQFALAVFEFPLDCSYS